MEFQFECGCGEEVSDFTRGGESDISVNAICEECGSTYALTITTIRNEFE